MGSTYVHLLRNSRATHSSVGILGKASEGPFPFFLKGGEKAPKWHQVTCALLPPYDWEWCLLPSLS